LDRLDYNTKYREKLTCINNCKARIKFTESKSTHKKFFSTWNGDGALHEKTCPYHVDYKGKIGRKKLEEFFEGQKVPDDAIEESLLRKAKALRQEYDKGKISHPKNGSNKVDPKGNGDVLEGYTNETGGEDYTKRQYIQSKEAIYITEDDEKRIITVYGTAENVQIQKDKNGKEYAYINLISGITNVSVVFQEAFYSNEASNGVEEFEKFVRILKEHINSSGKTVEIIAYGQLKTKRSIRGINLNVIHPKHILIDSTKYNQIIIKGKI